MKKEKTLEELAKQTDREARKIYNSKTLKDKIIMKLKKEIKYILFPLWLVANLVGAMVYIILEVCKMIKDDFQKYLKG